MTVKENYSLKQLNTFHIDAFAEKFVEIFSEEELIELCRDGIKNYLLLGGGSNILLMTNPDLVIKNSIPGITVTEENDEYVFVTAGAGVIWNDLVEFAVSNNYGGIENLVLIPGTVGAAPIQNIGAYGEELKDTFHSLKAFFIKDCTIKVFNKNECRFGYRNSIFKNELKGETVILAVTLRLKKNPSPEVSYAAVRGVLEREGIKDITIRDISRIITGIRRSKLPDPEITGNAGSFFKNPEVEEIFYIKLKEKYPDIVSFKSPGGKVKLAAGWLIEKCGWKGKREGDAGCHKDQALVIVNYGKASGNEILEFSRKIKESVKSEFGVELEEEVNIIT